MTLIQADAFHLPYPDKLFHACVTSPPYWGLRKYAGDQGEEPLGLEATPERHIERMVEVFREVRRVLRDDGVVWLNYGDCFASSNARRVTEEESEKAIERGERLGYYNQPAGWTGRGDRAVMDVDVQAGNLMLMPHRLAIALQDDGWIVRNDLVWFKRNPMPESVAGWRWERKKIGEKKRIKNSNKQLSHRPYAEGFNTIQGGTDTVEWEYGDDYVLRKSSWRHTRQHEYVFMLVKKMGYQCNQEAVREPVLQASIDRDKAGWNAAFVGRHTSPNEKRPHSDDHTGFVNPSGRNPRSVLDVPTAPYKGAHYATFPPKLIAPLIRASVPRRCCPECGMAWAPVVEKGEITSTGGSDKGKWSEGQEELAGRTDNKQLFSHAVRVTDYRPTCECGIEDFEPGIVLDIFGGSGTTGMVAKQLLRRWVVMDISRPYLDEQSKIRTKTGTPSKTLEGLPLFEDLE